MAAAVKGSCSHCVFKSECIHTSFISSCSDSEQQQAPVLAGRVHRRAVGDLRLPSREAARAERPGRVDFRLKATGLRQTPLISGNVAYMQMNQISFLRGRKWECGRLPQVCSDGHDPTGRWESFIYYILVSCHCLCTGNHVAFNPLSLTEVHQIIAIYLF